MFIWIAKMSHAGPLSKAPRIRVALWCAAATPRRRIARIDFGRVSASLVEGSSPFSACSPSNFPKAPQSH